MSLNVFLLGVSALSGEQIIELLEDNPLTETTSIKLFDIEDQSGQSLMVGGKAHRVSPLETADFASADIVVLCAPDLPDAAVSAAIASASVLDLHNHAACEGAPLLVSEINASAFSLKAGAIYRSPEPALLATALLLKALEPSQVQPLRVSATLIYPASLHDQKGVQALATETAHLLNGREAPTKMLDASLAFNLIAQPLANDETGEMWVETQYASGLPELVDEDLEVSVNAIEAPLFHGTGVTLIIEVQNKAEVEKLIQAIDRQPKLRFTRAASASTQSVTGVDHVLVTRLRLDKADDRVIKLTLMFDEQRVGRASNAVGLIGSLTPKH